MLTCDTCGADRWDDQESCPHCGNRSAWYKPGPIQIRTECLRIQAGWSQEQEQQRRSGAYRRVEWLAAEVTGEAGRVNRKGPRDD